MEETTESTGGSNEKFQLKDSVQDENSLSNDISMDCNGDEQGETEEKVNKLTKRIIQDKKKFAHLQNYINPGTNISRKFPTNFRDLMSRDMTKDDIKMLDFYKKRLTKLKHDNDLLHKRLVFIVNENMRLLKMKPALKLQVTRTYSG